MGRSSCNGRCGFSYNQSYSVNSFYGEKEVRRLLVCNCDIDCIQLGDCCLDFPIYCLDLLVSNYGADPLTTLSVPNQEVEEEWSNVSNFGHHKFPSSMTKWPENANKYFGKLVRLSYNLIRYIYNFANIVYGSIRTEGFTCKKIFNHKNFDIFVRVVTSCANGLPCHYDRNQWGMQYIFTSPFIYVNKDCALCNNIEPQEWSQPVAQVYCNKHVQDMAETILPMGSNIFFHYASRHCLYFFISEGVDIGRHMCQKVDDFNLSRCKNTQDKQACRLYGTFMYDTAAKNMANGFCAYCQYDTWNSIVKSGNGKCKIPPRKSHRRISASFSILFDFEGQAKVTSSNGHLIQGERSDSPQNCMNTEVWFNGHCHPLPVPARIKPKLKRPDNWFVLLYTVKDNSDGFTTAFRKEFKMDIQSIIIFVL